MYLKDIQLVKVREIEKQITGFGIKLTFSDGTFAASNFDDTDTKYDVVEALLNLASKIEESI